MKHYKLAAVFAAVAMLISGMATAGMQYTYVQAAQSQGEGDDDDDVDRVSVTGSIALGSNFHALYSFGTGTNDEAFGDFDHDEIGLGWHNSVGENTDILAEIRSGEVDWDDTDAGDYTAYRFGVRRMVTDNFELEVATSWWDVDEEVQDDCCGDEDEVSAEISGRYHINDSASIAVGWTEEDPRLDDDDVITFDFRWAFDDVM